MMGIITGFLLFISLILLAIYGLLEKMERRFDVISSFVIRWGRESKDEGEDTK